MGFGSGSFGNFSFGQSGWVRKMLWGSVPVAHKAQDAESLYEKLFNAIQSEFSEIADSIDKLPEQRNPYAVRGDDEFEAVSIDSAVQYEDDYYGNVILCTCESGYQIDAVGPGWTATIGDIEYEVLSIGMVNAPNTLMLRADTVPSISPPQDVVFTAQSMLKLLGKDFGVDVDDAEPMYLQRASVAHAVQYWNLKGGAKGYSVRGDMSGFSVSAIGLYALQDADAIAALPSYKLFELPDSSGDWYTSVEPRVVLMDEVALDQDESSMTLDALFLYDDTSVDGMSPAKAWAENVIGTIEVTAVTALNASELSQFNLSFGYKVTCQITYPGATPVFSDYSAFGWFNDGAYSLVSEFDDGQGPIGTEFVIDGEISGGDASELVVGTVSAPALGFYHFRYFPGLSASCSWCMTHKIRITAAPSEALIATGVDVVDAMSRLRLKLNKLVPVHVEIVDYALVIEMEVIAHATVAGTVIVT